MSLLDLDLAMEALAREKTSLAQLIEMRYFGGMSAEETAEVLGRSVHVRPARSSIGSCVAAAGASRARLNSRPQVAQEHAHN